MVYLLLQETVKHSYTVSAVFFIPTERRNNEEDFLSLHILPTHQHLQLPVLGMWLSN